MSVFSVEGLLCDVHGVLYTHPDAIPGSVEAVSKLLDREFPVVFLTNSTQFPKRHVMQTLHDLGFPLKPNQVMTAVESAGGLIRSKGFKRVGWLAPEGLAEDIPGVEVCLPEEVGSAVDAVLVGDIGDRFSYKNLNQAFRWINDGAALVAMARNRFYQTPAGLTLDSGPFVKLLEESAGVSALVTGKPSPAFFQAGLQRLGLAAEQVAMVGDDLEFDVLAAMDAGLQGIQVRTGKFREEQLQSSPRKPTAVLEDLLAVASALS